LAGKKLQGTMRSHCLATLKAIAQGSTDQRSNSARGGVQKRRLAHQRSI